MKLFQSKRLAVAGGAAAVALVAVAAVMFLSAEPAYACTPGGGKVGSLLDLVGKLLGR
ncbi:MAG: hypothetical protein KF769_08430 [Parvibaculum sp.]|uniref:hypothetical protein n=1 Tax=Parvibaculum sp. TaxID=2024848 RepID=UPI001DFCE1D0|nr:hypothetical protein [Parvibaculum sp.]MBX3490627.1 hypothetical protein [Parvibaculum sp.]MBX3496255.1 hypothetical protein [Parvibaculum sp.]MCW5728486.1 hypothetical protein [Parvibaculum sp.]